ncbi:MAG: hydrogenase maturation protease [Candidatus Dormibacteria bacterium]
MELLHRGVLVVACGNTLRGDDAVGPEVGELLAARLDGTGASVIVSDQLLPELADDASRARLVVIVDAAADRPVGSVSVRALAPRRTTDAVAGAGPADGEAARPPGPFSHGMGPEDLLALTRDLYAATPDAVLVSVGAESLEPGAELSESVRLAIPRAVEVVLQVILEGTRGVWTPHA